MHSVGAGIEAEKAAASLPAKQRIRDTPGKVLGKIEDAKAAPVTRANTTAKHGAPKDTPDQAKPPGEAPNTKKQSVADAAIAADRERITLLSNQGRIDEARAVLQPYVDAAKAGKTLEERKAAMEAIVARLDVTSDKEKMFWSGNDELAAKIARENGKIVLEQTPGGKVIDKWKDLNIAFPWDDTAMGPRGVDFWGSVSTNYSKDAVGAIDVIQDMGKFPGGGGVWRAYEFPTIKAAGKVTAINIFGMDRAGNIMERVTVSPYSAEARKLFGGD